MVCLGTVVGSSAPFVFTVTMARPVEVSCADRGGRTPSINSPTATTIANLQPPVFIVQPWPCSCLKACRACSYMTAEGSERFDKALEFPSELPPTIFRKGRSAILEGNCNGYLGFRPADVTC